MIRDRLRQRDDEGMTLVELLITSTILVVVLGMVLVSMNLISTISGNVTSQYREFDQALPAMAPFQSLLAAEIEPGPETVNGTPTSLGLPNTISQPDPPFTQIGNFSMTFYANIGAGYANTLGCPTGQTCVAGGSTAGPAKIVVEELGSADTPVTSSTACNPTSPCSLQVQMYLPDTGTNGTAGSPSCPLLWGSYVNLLSTCTYSTPYRLLADIQNVVNDPSKHIGTTQAPSEPIFTYSLFDTGGTYTNPSTGVQTTYNDQDIPLTSTEVSNQTITGLYTTYGYPTDSQSLTACAPTSAAFPTVAVACPADAIQSVGIDLRIQEPGTSSAEMVDDDVVIYRYAQSPGSSTAPYQYSETQG